MWGPDTSILLAESVQLDPANGELSAFRFFDSLTCTGFPVNTTFWVLGKIWGLETGKEVEAVFTVTREPEGELLARSDPHRWQPDSRHHVHTAVHRFDGLVLTGEGTYLVGLEVDGETVGTFPLRARLGAMPQTH
jgi:hypothetical protein